MAALPSGCCFGSSHAVNSLLDMALPALTFTGQARAMYLRTGKPWFDEDGQRDSIVVYRVLTLSGQEPLTPSVRIAAGISDEESDGAICR
jgi:hypothetical protein